jgi:hypothetical protein
MHQATPKLKRGERRQERGVSLQISDHSQPKATWYDDWGGDAVEKELTAEHLVGRRRRPAGGAR